MVPFKYGDFYDVPRAVLFKYQGHLIYMLSRFDEEKDDYDDHYTISLLPFSLQDKLAVSWEILFEDVGARRIGTISVKKVAFDSSKRSLLDASFMDAYLEELEADPKAGRSA